MIPLVLIQAREGGTRFPGKINQWIGSRRMWEHVAHRVRLSGLRYLVCRPEDWPEVPEEDVLGRFAAVMRLIDDLGEYYDPLIRITADCPLLDHGLLTGMLTGYLVNGPEDLLETGPEWDGLDVQIFSAAMLWRAHEAAIEPSDREHVTPWMKRNGRSREVPLNTTLRWSVDDSEGLEFVREVFRLCEHCEAGVPRHTNASGSIGGSDRHPIWDLHHLGRGDLAECQAFDLLKTRMGGPIYVSPP